MTKNHSPADQQEPHARKVENDHNKMGEQEASQLNQGHRTPESRSDRESHVGSGNQSQERRHSPGHGD